MGMGAAVGCTTVTRVVCSSTGTGGHDANLLFFGMGNLGMGYMAYRVVIFTALVIIGTFNREMTGVLLWLSLFAAYPRRWQWWLPTGLLLAFILIGLRLMIHAEPASATAQWVLNANTQTWRADDAILYQGLLVPLWILLYRRMRGVLAVMVACVLIPYLLLFAVWGIWQEVRLLMPVFILGIPFARKVFRD